MVVSNIVVGPFRSQPKMQESLAQDLCSKPKHVMLTCVQAVRAWIANGHSGTNGQLAPFPVEVGSEPNNAVSK
jgi:hypothetical protein